MRKTTLIWLVLIIATIYSMEIGQDQLALSRGEAPWLQIQIIAIAMFKARMVLIHFMGVGAAGGALRYVCEAWVLIVAGALIGIPMLWPHGSIALTH